MKDAGLELRRITKSFPGIIAIDDITLSLSMGEIHGLLGDNGAGKSTLTGVLFGLYRPDGGEIWLDGKKVRMGSPKRALALGIALAGRHGQTAESLSVLDSVLLGAEDACLGVLQRRKAREKLAALMAKYGLEVDLDARMGDLPAGAQFRAEILKALYRGCCVLILDEPGDVLTALEVEHLAQLARQLAGEGKAILWASRRPGEIIAAADRCTVLRRGRCVGTVNVAETAEETLYRMMLGGDAWPAEKKEIAVGSVVLEARDVTAGSGRNAVRHASLEVRAGEIVCLTGVRGSGQEALMAALTGLLPLRAGRIRLKGKDLARRTVRERARMGVSLIPADRLLCGLAPEATMEEGLLLQRYWQRAYQESGFLRRREARRYARRLAEEWGLAWGEKDEKTARELTEEDRLWAVVAREIDRGADLLLAEEPTRGLDADAAEGIREKLLAVRASRKAVLVAVGDPEEALRLSDRILVMRDGEIVGEFDPKYATVRELGLYMAGTLRQGEEESFDEI